MGMHQDRDEADFKWPVVSVSLGDEGLFRIGNQTRGGKTESIWLHSGDVVVMGGEARLSYHGVDRDPVRIFPFVAERRATQSDVAGCDVIIGVKDE